MKFERNRFDLAPAAIALAALLSAVVMLNAHSEPDPPPRVDPARFILNALLVPALDGDAVPLRWVDPRPRSSCDPATEVRVNREPLVAGALVPDMPFELEWRAAACRPFGTAGPRLDGRVRLTVFREDWGFSAIVEPEALRVAHAGQQTILTERSAAVLPVVGDAAERDAPALWEAGD